LKYTDINSIKIHEVWQQQKSLGKPYLADVSLPGCGSLDTQKSCAAGRPTFIQELQVKYRLSWAFFWCFSLFPPYNCRDSA